MAHQRAGDVGELVGLYAVTIVIETLYCFIPGPPVVKIQTEFRIFSLLFVDSSQVAFIDLVVFPIKRCLFLIVLFYNIVLLVSGRVVGCYASSRMFCIFVLAHDELNSVFPLFIFSASCLSFIFLYRSIGPLNKSGWRSRNRLFHIIVL